MSNSIKPRYETRRPSAQTIVDIFRGTWKSKLPDGLESGGDAPMFDDQRPRWFNSIYPGGLAGRSILELGPFEGYQTLAMERLGAQVTAVEGNTLNFLKCVCLKEALDMSAKFKLGDIVEELSVEQAYDAVWASGVLYHMQEPVKALELCCARAPHVYVWTHYFDAEILAAAPEVQRSVFVSALDREVEYAGGRLRLHARRYGIPDYENNIPLYWEGAPKEVTYWMELPDIEFLFSQNGFKIKRNHVGTLNGLPVISFAASKRP